MVRLVPGHWRLTAQLARILLACEMSEMDVFPDKPAQEKAISSSIDNLLMILL